MINALNLHTCTKHRLMGDKNSPGGMEIALVESTLKTLNF